MTSKAEIQFQTTSELINKLIEDPETLERFKADPMPILARLVAQERHPHSDSFIYRLVVVILALVIGVIVGGELFIYVEAALNSQETIPKIPDFLVAACSTSIGALAGLLAPIPNGRPH